MDNKKLRLYNIKSILKIPANSNANTLKILRYFEDSDLLIKHLPKSIENVYIYKNEDEDKIFNLKFLEHLPNLKKLKFLHKNDDDDSVIKTNLCEIKLPISLEILKCNLLVLDSFTFIQHLKNLKKLVIYESAVEKIKNNDLPKSIEKLILIDESSDSPTLKNTDILKNCKKIKHFEMNINDIEYINDFYFPLSLEYINVRGTASSTELDFSKHKNLRHLILYELTINKLIIPETITVIRLYNCVVKKEIIDNFPITVEKDLYLCEII